jgi:hypothetical protein
VEHATLGGGGAGDGLGETLPAAAFGLALDDALPLAAGADSDAGGRAATVVVPQPVAAIMTNAVRAIPLIGVDQRRGDSGVTGALSDRPYNFRARKGRFCNQ